MYKRNKKAEFMLGAAIQVGASAGRKVSSIKHGINVARRTKGGIGHKVKLGLSASIVKDAKLKLGEGIRETAEASAVLGARQGLKTLKQGKGKKAAIRRVGATIRRNSIRGGKDVSGDNIKANFIPEEAIGIKKQLQNMSEGLGGKALSKRVDKALVKRGLNPRKYNPDLDEVATKSISKAKQLLGYDKSPTIKAARKVKQSANNAIRTTGRRLTTLGQMSKPQTV